MEIYNSKGWKKEKVDALKSIRLLAKIHKNVSPRQEDRGFQQWFMGKKGSPQTPWFPGLTWAVCSSIQVIPPANSLDYQNRFRLPTLCLRV